jgi:hypothetical protein
MGNLKGFLKGMEGIDLRDDYTFDYKNEQFEVEPIINSDDNGVSNAVFTIFDGDGEEQGEITYSREGGKQKFTANSMFFQWRNAKFEDGGYFDGTIPKVSTYMTTYADGGSLSEKEQILEALENYDSDDNEFEEDQQFFVTDDLLGFIRGLRVSDKESIVEALSDYDGDDFVVTSPLLSFVENINLNDNYAKGGEIAKAEIFGLSRNIMGTTDIEMKITGMRKAQDFIVYPIGADDAGNVITIQSDTRIGQINLVKGVGVMSQSHSSGAYFVHLQMDKLTSFTISESDLENLKAFINKTSGANVGSSVVKSDNSGASGVYAKGGSFEKVMWQDVEIGDSARVKELNRMGLITHTYGRKFNIKFPNGTEKTFDASDLEFYKLEKDQYELDNDNNFAKGGVTYFDDRNQHYLGRPSGSIEKEIYAKVKDRIDADDFVGSFGWKIVSNKQANIADGFLYKLDDYDQNLIKNLNLKQGEKVFRYVNRTTAIGGMMPFIKINIEKALLYFPVSNDNDDIIFETKSVKPMWINLIEGSFAHGGGLDMKYYVIDVKDGKVVSKGFDTEEEAKVEKFEIFEKTNNFFLSQKKMSKNEVDELSEQQYAKGGDLVKTPFGHGEFLWFFNWKDGGFNEVYAETKAKAIKKATQKGYPTYMPDNEYARKRSLQDIKDQFGQEAVDYIRSQSTWSNEDQKYYSNKDLKLTDVGFSKGLVPDGKTFRKQTYKDSRETTRMGNMMSMADGGGIELGDVVEVKEPNYGRDSEYYVVDNKAGYNEDGFLLSETRKREQGVFEEDQLNKLYADGGFMNDVYANGGGLDMKYYVIDVKDGKVVSKGFDTEEEAKVEKFEIFEKTNNFFLSQKKMSKNEADGLSEQQYAKGGITYYKNENERLSRPKSDMEQEVFDKVKNQINPELFSGNFGWKAFNNKLAYGYLYALDDFDKDYVKNVKLKQGEVIFRYVTRITAISGSVPFIKINIEKSLLYFPVSLDDEDVIFETRGVTPLWISLIEGSFADGGFMNDVYAYGGQIRIGDRFKSTWTDGKNNSGYDIIEIKKQDVTSGKDFKTKVMITEIVDSSSPERIGLKGEEYKPNFKKNIGYGLYESMQDRLIKSEDKEYADGGKLSKIETSKSGKLKTDGEVIESWYNVFGEGIVNDKGEEVGSKMNDINKDVVYYQVFAKDTPENREGYGWEEHNDEVGFIFKKFATIDDLERFLNEKEIEETKEALLPKGGSVKKDWWHTVVNPNEDFNNFDDKMPIDWDVDDFKSWVVSNSDIDGNVDKEVLDVVKMPKSKLLVEYLNKNGSGKNNNEFYKKYGNWQSALYDIFTQMKKDYLFKKSLKYVLKADIKTVTVKTKNGKEVTYSGADVLNGNYVLAKGGDITSKATYFGKNNVVGVELKDGTTVKPVNGYWVKKGAEPISNEPTPAISVKSETNVGQTFIKKGAYGWSATTTINDFNNYDWKVSTHKTSRGELITTAQGGKFQKGDGYTTFKFMMYEDPFHTLEVSKPSRLTEKVVAEQHAKGLDKFKKFMETGMFKGGGKISNFDKLSAKVAKQYEGKPVKNQYQEEYGKFYSKEEAQEVGDKVAGKVKAMQTDSKAFGGLFNGVKKMTTPSQKYPNIEGKQVALKTGEFVEVFSQSGSNLTVLELGKIGSGKRPYPIDISEIDLTSFKAGGETEIKKTNKGSEILKQANELAKKIRMDGESWTDAKKRAFAQLKK